MIRERKELKGRKGLGSLFTLGFARKHSKLGGNQACLERIVISGHCRMGAGGALRVRVMADGSRDHSSLEIRRRREVRDDESVEVSGTTCFTADVS